MSRRRKTIEIKGVTRVFGCCEFGWTEGDGKRVATVPEGAHEACIAELERAAERQGVRLVLDEDETVDSSGVFPLIIDIAVKA